ncbi:hypothetical protein AX17_007124 [Amanita inopinata Kibby_2008]|nr:hypothetical protein AX17_007124 [Amanita inopinata Kibby_2008]
MSHSVSGEDMSEERWHNGRLGLVGRGHGKASGVPSVGRRADAVGRKDEDWEARRLSLLAEKQSQLQEAYDRHDTLVREVFHMENFRMMLAFDPQEAKSDNSQVLQEYKSKYDLLEKTDSALGPARKTRSAHTERRQIIPSISAPSTPARISTRKPIHTPKLAKAHSNAMWDIIVHAKGKVDSRKERDDVSEEDEDIHLLRRDETQSSRAVPQRREPGKTRRRSAADEAVLTGSSKNKRAIGESGSSVPIRRSDRQKTLGAAPPADNHAAMTQQSDVLMVTPSKRPARRMNGLTEPPKFKIKRIKLVVRRPPPLISHPLQRPPLPKFNSLHAFLSSYFSPSDRVVDEAVLERQVHKEAIVMERVHRLRQEGHFIPASDELTTESLAELRISSLTPKRISKDMWDDVVAAATGYGRAKARRATGRHVAGQIATKIKAYWDGQETRREKVKALEERQLRALAKETIRMVANEWKKAVFHIRERERLKQEAEERKRGHEHLDAILNQSGYILRTQQGDLTRSGASRSRSHSTGTPVVSEDEEEASEEEGSDKEGTDAGAGEEADEGEELDELKSIGDDGEGRDVFLIGESEAVLTEGGQEDEDMEAVDEDDWFDTRMLLGDKLRVESPDEMEVSMSPPEDVAQTVDEVIQDSSSRQTSPSVATPHLLNEVSEEKIETPLGPSQLLCSEGSGVEETHAATVAFASPKLPSAESLQNPSVTGEKSLDVSLALSETQRKEIAATVTTVALTPSKLEATEPLVEPGVEDNAKEDAAKDSDDEDGDSRIPAHLKPYAVAPVDWDPNSRITPPLLFRGVLRPYQQAGLEWLASLHSNYLNGILADEMGLGKTIQTIALFAHLACDRGIWGPHLIVVPTSVLLNWEMEFKKFLPGFKTLSYHGSTKRRKELRQGWNDRHHFNVCITSYTLASRDAHIFKRKQWYYMVLDEAHMIKNFKSHRWNTLLMFRSFRRLLLTGTPLQNNLTELWALLKFLMSGSNFVNLKEFGEWFSNPLEKAIEMGNVLDDETMRRVTKLHTVLRPYLLRRLKRDVEKELPSKFEHLVLCPLSKRQRFLYDEFMSRAQTQDALHSGVYQKIANILMQLRKVCNHPDLFEVRPIVTSFAMTRSAITDFEIKELLVRRQLLHDDEERVDFGLLGLQFVERQDTSIIVAMETRRLDATSQVTAIAEMPGDCPPKDFRTIAGYQKYAEYMRHAQTAAHWVHLGYLNRLRCHSFPVYSRELITATRFMYQPLLPTSAVDIRRHYMDTSKLLASAVLSYEKRAESMFGYIDRFAFITPPVVALDLPRVALAAREHAITSQPPEFDHLLHRASVKLQIAFPDPSLLQYDCGKLQELARLLREKKAGGHRILIFTQMTRILDILEIFLNFHGYLYLRLDGATKIEDRQYITERFNADDRVFCFISSSRSGGVGINLTGADTVVFYDSDFNPQMDRQCEDRAHRIGQIRDVHIYRFVSQYTVEEAMLRKANQKRSLDDLVIQKGEFDWRSLFNDESALTKALEEFEDLEDAHAAAVAAREEIVMGDADEADFADDGGNVGAETIEAPSASEHTQERQDEAIEEAEEEQEGGTTIDYMIAFVKNDYDFFRDWRI